MLAYPVLVLPVAVAADTVSLGPARTAVAKATLGNDPDVVVWKGGEGASFVPKAENLRWNWVAEGMVPGGERGGREGGGRSCTRYHAWP